MRAFSHQSCWNYTAEIDWSEMPSGSLYRKHVAVESIEDGEGNTITSKVHFLVDSSGKFYVLEIEQSQEPTK